MQQLQCKALYTTVILKKRGLLEHALNEGMTKSKGGGGKRINDGRVHRGGVSVAVTVCNGDNVKLVHEINTQDYWKPFVVGYVLKETK